MKEEEIKAVCTEKAIMNIVCGYAFSQSEEGFIRVSKYPTPAISCSCDDEERVM